MLVDIHFVLERERPVQVVLVLVQVVLVLEQAVLVAVLVFVHFVRERAEQVVLDQPVRLVHL